MFSRVFYAGRAFKEDHDVSAMIYPPNILYFVDKNKGQIVTKFAIVLFNTQVKSLKHDGHLCTFRNFMLTFLLHNNEYLKDLAG